MAPTFVKTDDAVLKKTEDEVAAVLVHKVELLRLKNRLRSPLLRLPTEIIVRILSYIMEYVGKPRTWRPIFSTCHHIHRIMGTATELWWKVDCAWAWGAYVIFQRSEWSPEVMIAELNPWDPDAEEVLDYWRDKQALRGHRLHTLELCGIPSDIAHFSWIFERPLPRLRRLRIDFSGPLDNEGNERPMSGLENSRLPVTLQLPTDMPLQVLYLRNTMLPWSSSLFTGLRELDVDFTGCNVTVDISEDELFRILGASPQLERLSLMKVGPRIPDENNRRRFTHQRIVQLPSLASLRLGTTPEVVGFILAHVDTPAVVSLWIHSDISSRDVGRSLDLLIPNNHLYKRLFSDPPLFEIQATDSLVSSVMAVYIGGFGMQIAFDFGDGGIVRNPIMTRIMPLVPPSVTVLKINCSGLGLDELEWREFFSSHPEVRSIECPESSWKPVPKSLWDALSPSGPEAAPPCPMLESISLFCNPSPTHLLNCLISRKCAGFGLKYLEVTRVVDELAEKLRPLVEKLRASKPDIKSEEVRPVSMDELDIRVMTGFQWRLQLFLGDWTEF